MRQAQRPESDYHNFVSIGGVGGDLTAPCAPIPDTDGIIARPRPPSRRLSVRLRWLLKRRLKTDWRTYVRIDDRRGRAEHRAGLCRSPRLPHQPGTGTRRVRQDRSGETAVRFITSTAGADTRRCVGQPVFEPNIGRLWSDPNGCVLRGHVSIAGLVGLPTVRASDIVIIA